MIAKNILETAGYKIITANNGQEAIDIFKERKENIDLILMDLHMPVKNGYQAAAEINEISKVPIIAITADVIEGVKEKCEDAGIFDYISKPFVPEELINKIEEILELNNFKKNDNDIINFKKGLKNTGANMEIYKKILRNYYTEKG